MASCKTQETGGCMLCASRIRQGRVKCPDCLLSKVRNMVRPYLRKTRENYPQADLGEVPESNH